jgi:UDP-2,3-diacylglucosamine pyrophosphatase LpxH
MVAKGMTWGGSLTGRCWSGIRYGPRRRAHRRLSQVFERAARVSVDDGSRFVFFADCHRGDRGRSDAFARNSDLFLHALRHYYRRGFTYVEVGDGDELWQNRRFADVRRAYGRVFDLFHAFAQQQRLHLIVGNHDIQRGRRDRVDKDGLVAREGLVLKHAVTGQQVFVVHGHQADFKSDRLAFVSEIAVRALKQVQRLGLARYANLPRDVWSQCKTDRWIRQWAHARRQAVICGHTHRPSCASYGAPPYFNTGSCLAPGAITGLEVQNGQISLIRWTGMPGGARRCASDIRREQVLPSTALWAR